MLPFNLVKIFTSSVGTAGPADFLVSAPSSWAFPDPEYNSIKNGIKKIGGVTELTAELIYFYKH